MSDDPLHVSVWEDEPDNEHNHYQSFANTTRWSRLGKEPVYRWADTHALGPLKGDIDTAKLANLGNVQQCNLYMENVDEETVHVFIEFGTEEGNTFAVQIGSCPATFLQRAIGSLTHLANAMRDA